MLTIDGRSILNIRDFLDHFSIQDALAQHREFAAFAVRTLGSLNDLSRAMGMLFALCSMRLDGRLDQLSYATLPHLRVAEGEIRTLLESPLPAPDQAHAHMCALARCFAQEAQTALLIPARTSRAAAAFAASCDLSPARRKTLFVMLVSACRLGGVSWDRISLTAQQACDAVLGRSGHADDIWATLPPSGDLLLPEREKPWRLLVHPAWLAEPACRTLPEGCRLDVLRIRAVPHAHGSRQFAAAVQFFADASAPEPIAEAVLRSGGYVTVTAVCDASGVRMPLPPRADRYEAGRDVLIRSDRNSDALEMNGKPVQGLQAGSLTGFAPDGSGGFIVLRDGLVDASAFTRRAFLQDLLLDVSGERFIDVAVRGTELTLLCPDGHVISSYDHLRTPRALLTLDDYFA